MGLLYLYIQYLGEIVPSPPSASQNTVTVCNQITFLILNYITSRLVTLRKVIDAPIQVPNIFDLTVSFKFLNFSFQIYLLFVPETSTSITSYIFPDCLHCFGLGHVSTAF